jgi:hypothetical protein
MGASTPARYLRELNAQFYLDDAVALMARVRPERPGAFLQAYFQNVLALEHTVGRDFEFVNATARNRGAFLRSCHAAFGHLDDASELMVGDLHQVVSLLCPTFPEGRVLEIPRLMREDTSARIPFGALSTAFFVHFSFYDHLLELKKLFVQPGKGDVPPEWRSVALAEALRHVTMGVTGTTGNGAPAARPKPNDQGGCLPAAAVSRAFRSDAALTFDEFVYRLLGDAQLALALVRDAESGSAEWLPRHGPSGSAVASLFAPRNARGEAGPDDDGNLAKASKPKAKDKGKASSKKR